MVEYRTHNHDLFIDCPQVGHFKPVFVAVENGMCMYFENHHCNMKEPCSLGYQKKGKKCKTCKKDGYCNRAIKC